MLKVERNESGDVFKLSGSVDENDKLQDLLGILPGKTTLSCAELRKINSVGVKAWINFFISQTGKEIIFVDLSPALVEQANMISNFFQGCKVESIQLPYTCSQCNSTFAQSKSVTDLKTSGFQVPVESCPTCGNPGEFDDIEDEYFFFLKKP